MLTLEGLETEMRKSKEELLLGVVELGKMIEESHKSSSKDIKTMGVAFTSIVESQKILGEAVETRNKAIELMTQRMDIISQRLDLLWSFMDKLATVVGMEE